MPMDLVMDPVDLPVTWPDGTSTAGLGYVAGAGGRVSEMRGLYVADPYYWATCPAPAVTLEPEAAADAGEEYRSWRERRDQPTNDTPVAVGEEPKTIRDAVLAQLRSRGQVRTGVLADAVGAKLSTVSSTLRRLEQEGLAADLGYAEWAAKETAA